MAKRVRLRGLLRAGLFAAAVAGAPAALALTLPDTDITTYDGPSGALFSLSRFESFSSRLERSLRPSAYHLWEGAGFGREPRERAAWVLSGDAGRMRWQVWPDGRRYLKAGWAGPVPADAIAIVHTHPLAVDPKPSPQDIATARRIRVPVYTVSRVGIWRASPDGSVVAVEDETWWSGCRSGGCGAAE
jgi:hypothetical protein